MDKTGTQQEGLTRKYLPLPSLRGRGASPTARNAKQKDVRKAPPSLSFYLPTSAPPPRTSRVPDTHGGAVGRGVADDDLEGLVRLEGGGQGHGEGRAVVGEGVHPEAERAGGAGRLGEEGQRRRRLGGGRGAGGRLPRGRGGGGQRPGGDAGRREEGGGAGRAGGAGRRAGRRRRRRRRAGRRGQRGRGGGLGGREGEGAGRFPRRGTAVGGREDVQGRVHVQHQGAGLRPQGAELQHQAARQRPRLGPQLQPQVQVAEAEELRAGGGRHVRRRLGRRRRGRRRLRPGRGALAAAAQAGRPRSRSRHGAAEEEAAEAAAAM